MAAVHQADETGSAQTRKHLWVRGGRSEIEPPVRGFLVHPSMVGLLILNRVVF